MDFFEGRVSVHVEKNTATVMFEAIDTADDTWITAPGIYYLWMSIYDVSTDLPYGQAHNMLFEDVIQGEIIVRQPNYIEFKTNEFGQFVCNLRGGSPNPLIAVANSVVTGPSYFVPVTKQWTAAPIVSEPFVLVGDHVNENVAKEVTLFGHQRRGEDHPDDGDSQLEQS